MINLESRAFLRLCERLEVFWPAGLALLQIACVSRWLNLKGEEWEWAQYLCLGTLFPALLLAITTASTRWRQVERALLPVKLGLAGYALAVCGAFAFQSFSAPILIVAIVQWALIVAFRSARLRFCNHMAVLELPWKAVDGDSGRRDLVAEIMGLFLVVLSWRVAVRMVWWTSFVNWVAESTYTYTVLLAALVLVTGSVFLGSARASRARPWMSRSATVLGLVILAMVSLRVDTLGAAPPSSPWYARGQCAFYHWGAIVAPADLVRQGGWLLWDIPTQYGFLSTLALALMPFKSIWQSFYVLNAVVMFAAAAMVFCMYRSLGRGWLNWIFSLAVALASVLLVQGWPRPLEPTGPHVTPAVGAFRFFFCFALLAALVWEFRSDPRARNPWPLLAGNVCWAVGTLWSVESAAYCATIWLPAYLALLCRRALALEPEGETPPWRARLRVAAWLAMPPCLLAAAAAGITLYYVSHLGHGPDWMAFIDPASAAKVFALPMQRDGTVLVLLLLFSTLATVAVACARSRRSIGALGLIGGAWGALWAVGSYFVGRSHEVNGVNIYSVAFAAVAVCLYLLQRDRAADRVAPFVKMALVPVLTMLVTMTFGVPAQLPATLAAIRRGYQRRIDRALPRMDPYLTSLLDGAHVKFVEGVTPASWGSPLPARVVVRGGPKPRPRVVTYRNWALPSVVLFPLPEQRREIYMERYAERTQQGGWLVIPLRPTPRDRIEFYLKAVEQAYRPVASLELGPWRLTRYEVKETLQASRSDSQLRR